MMNREEILVVLGRPPPVQMLPCEHNGVHGAAPARLEAFPELRHTFSHVIFIHHELSDVHTLSGISDSIQPEDFGGQLLVKEALKRWMIRETSCSLKKVRSIGRHPWKVFRRSCGRDNGARLAECPTTKMFFPEPVEKIARALKTFISAAAPAGGAAVVTYCAMKSVLVALDEYDLASLVKSTKDLFCVVDDSEVTTAIRFEQTVEKCRRPIFSVFVNTNNPSQFSEWRPLKLRTHFSEDEERGAWRPLVRFLVGGVMCVSAYLKAGYAQRKSLCGVPGVVLNVAHPWVACVIDTYSFECIDFDRGHKFDILDSADFRYFLTRASVGVLANALCKLGLFAEDEVRRNCLDWKWWAENVIEALVLPEDESPQKDR